MKKITLALILGAVTALTLVPETKAFYIGLGGGPYWGGYYPGWGWGPGLGWGGGFGWGRGYYGGRHYHGGHRR